MMHYKPNASQAYTLPSRSKNPPHDQNLSKSMPAPTHWNTDWKKEVLATTKAIRNLCNVLILKFLALNKISGKLKINRFKIPNYA